MAKKAPMSKQENGRAKARAEGLTPFAATPILKGQFGGGPRVWHGVNPQRFAMQLPPASRGPIRSREVRADKGIPGYRPPVK